MIIRIITIVLFIWISLCVKVCEIESVFYVFFFLSIVDDCFLNTENHFRGGLEFRERVWHFLSDILYRVGIKRNFYDFIT